MSRLALTPEEAHQHQLDSYKRYNDKPERRSYQRHFARQATQVERRRSHNLMKKFGITLEQYNAILASQGGVCAICGNPETLVFKKNGIEKPRPLCVDHDHATGRVRALLCFRCNAYLGFLEWSDRNPEWTTQARSYIEVQC